MMQITAEQYAAALYEALDQVKPEDQDIVLDRFAQLLADNAHTSLLEQIAAAYLAYERRQKGFVAATVTFARPPSADGEKRILAELNRIFGKDMEVQKKLDASQIGGIVVETEDTRLDASVAEQLRQLKHTLSN